MRRAAAAAAALLLLGGGVAAARTIFRLPPRSRPDHAQPRRAARSGVLAGKLTDLAARHQGRSGLHTLPDGAAAFAARVILARTAEHTIDAQYYIWHDDLTGLLLLEELRRAADRGVRVRLLLDDNGIENLDPILTELDGHPCFEVRLYNPFTTRRFKQAGYAFDFLRLNRRMHNKSYTVDGLVTIGGGRNIGDEYFATGTQPTYVDLDLLAVGKIVADASEDFARYWNSGSAYPLHLLVDRPDPTDEPLARRLKTLSDGPQRAEYRREIEGNKTVRSLVAGTLPLEWTHAVLVSDPPAKTLDRAKRGQLLVGQLEDLLGEVRTSLDVVSPYFVPGEKGAEHFASLAGRGVRVRILTNSLEATDVLPVHAGYAKYRRRLLEAGVRLYELKAQAGTRTRRSDAGIAGSSGASLHAKSFAADGTRLYIGSFNLDPRSVHLNTEMGMLVYSRVLAGDMHGRFDREIDELAYEVCLDQGGDMVWVNRSDQGPPVTCRHDPGSSRLQRAGVRAIGWLPVQWLL